MKDRDNIIDELERLLAEKPEPPPPRKMPEFYRPIRGDIVDELLAKYINAMQAPVPVKRLGDGNYVFGSKKIFAKIMNGKLVIRVGGGFMVIEEFITAYAEYELSKIH